jgi:hypothetical protein
MPTLPPKADIHQRELHVRYGDLLKAARGPKAAMNPMPPKRTSRPPGRPRAFVSTRLELAVIQPIDIEQAFCE